MLDGIRVKVREFIQGALDELNQCYSIYIIIWGGETGGGR